MPFRYNPGANTPQTMAPVIQGAGGETMLNELARRQAAGEARANRFQRDRQIGLQDEAAQRDNSLAMMRLQRQKDVDEQNRLDKEASRMQNAAELMRRYPGMAPATIAALTNLTPGVITQVAPAVRESSKARAESLSRGDIHAIYGDVSSQENAALNRAAQNARAEAQRRDAESRFQRTYEQKERSQENTRESTLARISDTDRKALEGFVDKYAKDNDVKNRLESVASTEQLKQMVQGSSYSQLMALGQIRRVIMRDVGAMTDRDLANMQGTFTVVSRSLRELGKGYEDIREAWDAYAADPQAMPNPLESPENQKRLKGVISTTDSGALLGNRVEDVVETLDLVRDHNLERLDQMEQTLRQKAYEYNQVNSITGETDRLNDAADIYIDARFNVGGYDRNADPALKLSPDDDKRTWERKLKQTEQPTKQDVMRELENIIEGNPELGEAANAFMDFFSKKSRRFDGSTSSENNNFTNNAVATQDGKVTGAGPFQINPQAHPVETVTNWRKGLSQVAFPMFARAFRDAKEKGLDYNDARNAAALYYRRHSHYKQFVGPLGAPLRKGAVEFLRTGSTEGYSRSRIEGESEGAPDQKQRIQEQTDSVDDLNKARELLKKKGDKALQFLQQLQGDSVGKSRNMSMGQAAPDMDPNSELGKLIAAMDERGVGIAQTLPFEVPPGPPPAREEIERPAAFAPSESPSQRIMRLLAARSR